MRRPTRAARVVAVLPWLLLSTSVLAHEGEPDAGVPASDGGVPELPPEPVFETRVTARRPYTAASASTVRDEDFAHRPIGDPSDILEVTPGLLTVQHAGGGKANQYFLRGFDIDHGTDLALAVEGVPVNMVSHAHGQGYADLHFVIPELVEKLEVTKGPYAAEHGDFATAGAVNLVLRRHLHRSQVTFEGASFGRYRGLVIAVPELGDATEGYVAMEVKAENGPFLHPERLRRMSLLGSLTHALGPATRLTLQLQSYGADWNASGQLPLREVEAGRLDRFDAIDPTEGGSSQRHSARVALEHRDERGGRLSLAAYLLRYRLELFSNFTFFADDPVNGDQIDQRDDRTVSGFDGRYQREDLVFARPLRSTFGIRLRNDDIENGLHHTFERERLATRVDARIAEGSLGTFVEEDFTWLPWLRTVAGVRADLFGFQVHDRLEDVSLPDGATSGVRQQLLVSPKLSVVLSPLDDLQLFVNFGRGFHSNDARGVVREVARVTPLTPATGYELGARWRVGRSLDLAAAAWALDLDREIVWVGDEGTTEERGATTRRGGELELRYRILPWLRADADVTYTHARFVADTGAGTHVPLAPVWTWSGGLYGDHPSGFFGAVRLLGLSDRPANESFSLVAQGFTLVNVEAGYGTDRFRLSIEGRNVLNAEWRQAQFANASRLPGEAAPVEDVHFTPGEPISILASVTVFL